VFAGRNDAAMKLLNQERGFTVIEAVVAQAILMIGAISVWSMFVVGTRYNAQAEDKTVAANIAQLKMEEIMNTPFRYIVYDHPPGETAFAEETRDKPYWVHNTQGELIESLPGGRYEVAYPDGLDADPLRIRVTVSWNGTHPNSSVNLDTLVSMTPGRFR
jgi:type II secretory pathway pseudopilin PulG